MFSILTQKFFRLLPEQTAARAASTPASRSTHPRHCDVTTHSLRWAIYGLHYNLYDLLKDSETNSLFK